MTTRFKRPMLVLGITILVIQAVFVSKGIVYAEYNNDICNSTETASEIDDSLDWSKQKGGKDVSENPENTGELIPSIFNDLIGPIENNIASRDSTTVRFEDFYKASVIDSNNYLLRPEIIPMNAISLFVNDSMGTPILNGEEMVLGRAYSITRNTDQILEISKMGHDYKGNFVDISLNFQLVSATAAGGGTLTWSDTGIEIIPRNQTNHRATDIIYTLRTSYNDKSLGEVTDPILIQSSGIYRRETMKQESLYAVASKAANRSVTIDNLSGEYTLETSSGAVYNYYTSPTVDMSIVRESTGTILLSSYQMFTQFETLPQFNASPPEIFGIEESENFISKYSLVQEVPSFLTTSQTDLEISVNHPFGSDSIVVSAKDETGEEYKDYLNISSFLDGTVSIVIPRSLSGKHLEIEIEVPLDKNNDLYPYLNNGELLFDVSAENNLISETVTSTTRTWVRPWGDPVPQTVGLDTSTTDLDPEKFVDNLENKLKGDNPFVVGFKEEQTFNILGDISIGVVIESEISGIQNTIKVPVTVIENKGNVFVHYLDREGTPLADTDELVGKIGDVYETHAKEIENYHVVEEPDNAIGVYEDDPIEVTYIYDITPVTPVDPLDPEVEVNPENKPDLPEDQGLLSIDFVSSFNFGSQAISVHDQIYYAQPQRLLNEDGTVNESEERPNYLQISDRRSENERNGWTLAVTQKEQFKGEENQVLNGAGLSLSNQQVITAQGGEAPGLQSVPCTLVPGQRRTLLQAHGNEGTGTWIYRFGDGDTMGESIALDVPRGANPETTTYLTTLVWELGAIPTN